MSKNKTTRDMRESLDKLENDNTRKEFKQELKELLVRYGYRCVDKLLIHIGENDGVKGGEIIVHRYF